MLGKRAVPLLEVNPQIELPTKLSVLGHYAMAIELRKSGTASDRMWFLKEACSGSKWLRIAPFF